MPLDLAQVIAHVESYNNSQRLRFEPALYAAWGARPAHLTICGTISRIHTCSAMTAAMIACTSWGRYQILGENLYDPCAYDRTVFEFCADDAAQRTAFLTFLDRRGIEFTLDDILDDPAKREKFIVAYNGPGNVAAYWSNMQDAVASLSS